MHILSIHNNYQIRGGEDESRESEERLLRERGHVVDVFEETNDTIERYSPIQVAVNTVWSQRSYAQVRDQLQQKKYDIVHVQNFFPLISPSVHYAAKAQGVPVVQTLRNYRLICPNALFFRDGKVCEDCIGKAIPYPGVFHRCYRGNLPASFVVASMISGHRLASTWHKKVDVFIALTQFAKQKLIEGGLPANKILVKPNFVYPDPGESHQGGHYAIYVGRLSVEKGLDTLIEGWGKIQSTFPLKIVGDGPLAALVKDAAEKNPSIEWMGRRPMEEVHDLIGGAKFLVFPSSWYETFGRVAVEAFAKGTPVIAAKIGAIAELVEPGKTGLHFNPGDSKDLARQVDRMLSGSVDIDLMCHEARATFENKYTAQTNYKKILDIYEKAIAIASGLNQEN